MSVIPHELVASRRGRSSWDSQPTYELVYRCTGSSIATPCIDAVAATAPLSIADPLTHVPLFKKDWSWSPVTLDSFDLTVTYTDPKTVDDRRQLQTGEFRWTDDFTGVMQRTFEANNTSDYTANVSDPVPAYLGRSIGVKQNNGKWSVEGIDVYRPSQVRTLSYRFDGGYVTEAYLSTACDLVGTCNLNKFHGREEFTLLLVGMVCSNSYCNGNLSGPQIDFKFLSGKNFTEEKGNTLTIGEITSITKYAHQYIETIYIEDTDSSTTPPFVVDKPRWVRVHDLYYAEDWSPLGIG